jgi:hypothetical protein
MKRTCDELASSPAWHIHNMCDGQVNTIVMDEIDSTAGMPAPEGPSLRQKRFHSMLRQMVKERGGRRMIAAVGRIFGLSQPYTSDLYNGVKRIGHRKFDAAMKRVPMDQRFFDDETLGDNPDYRPFLKSRQPAEEQSGARRATSREPAFSPFQLLAELKATPEEMQQLAHLSAADLQTPGQVRTALKVMRQMLALGASQPQALEAAQSGAVTAGAVERGERLGGHRRERARPRPRKSPRKTKAADDQ